MEQTFKLVHAWTEEGFIKPGTRTLISTVNPVSCQNCHTELDVYQKCYYCPTQRKPYCRKCILDKKGHIVKYDKEGRHEDVNIDKIEVVENESTKTQN